MKKVFLGGTCSSDNWRDGVIKKLKLDYFNPIVADWNEEAKKRELLERRESDYLLYVITPDMKGIYSIAEVVDDSNKRPAKTLLCVIRDRNGKSFDEQMVKSIVALEEMIERNGARHFDNLDDVVIFLNGRL